MIVLELKKSNSQCSIILAGSQGFGKLFHNLVTQPKYSDVDVVN